MVGFTLLSRSYYYRICVTKSRPPVPARPPSGRGTVGYKQRHKGGGGESGEGEGGGRSGKGGGEGSCGGGESEEDSGGAGKEDGAGKEEP